MFQASNEDSHREMETGGWIWDVMWRWLIRLGRIRLYLSAAVLF